MELQSHVLAAIGRLFRFANLDAALPTRIGNAEQWVTTELPSVSRKLVPKLRRQHMNDMTVDINIENRVSLLNADLEC
jgi:hypothetical protein